MPKLELTDVEAKLLHTTKSGMLLDDGTRKVWVPISLVEDNKDGTFTMPTWLALDKELI
jgi:hypothetical protein